MDRSVKGYFGPHRWLSNFWHAPFFWQEIMWPTTEHAFQAMKTEDPAVWKIVSELASPSEAKRYGGVLIKRPDWEIICDDVMYCVNQEKFIQNIDLARKLIRLEGYYLEETNHWHDNKWGNCTCPKCANIEGENRLGKVHMRLVRAILDA